WPQEGPERGKLKQIHGWLADAGRLGFVPVPLAARDGQTVQEHAGRLWEVVPWMPGAPERLIPPAKARLVAAMGGLAAFHNSLAHHQITGPSPGMGRRLRELEELVAGGFQSLEQVLTQRKSDPVCALARRWLRAAPVYAPEMIERLRHVASQPVALQPCLRDLRAEHLLFEGDRLTGLVDFGAMDVESVAADLARLLADWVWQDRTMRAEALAAYAASRRLSESELALIDAFARSAAVLGAGHWVRWHFVEGRKFDDPTAVSQGLTRCIERLEKLDAGDGGKV
ncbi:MAG TPA: phosphotransferase, partial [Isosphaeraceae bacterium]|nr:phosphotransferase [Isosphaeraceae bacterium]